MELSIQEVMTLLPSAFLPEKAGNLRADVQFFISGDKGGDWVVMINQGTCSVIPGISKNPSVEFFAAAQDFLDVLTGKLDAMRAYMSGRLQVRGNMNLAMRLTKMFSAESFKSIQN